MLNVGCGEAHGSLVVVVVLVVLVVVVRMKSRE